MAIITGPWQITDFDPSDWTEQVSNGPNGIVWQWPNLKTNYQWDFVGNYSRMGKSRVKSNFELKGDFECRVYWNRTEDGAFTDTHVKGFVGLFQEVPPSDPSGDLYNHNLRIWYPWQNAYLFHGDTHYAYELIDTPYSAGGTSKIYTIRRRGNLIKIYERSNWTLPAEGDTPTTTYTLESDAPLYFEMAEADGTSSGGGSSDWQNFSYSSSGITETTTLYINGEISQLPQSNSLYLTTEGPAEHNDSLYLSIVGMPHPPTGQLGEIPLRIGGPALINNDITLVMSGIGSPIVYHSGTIDLYMSVSFSGSEIDSDIPLIITGFVTPPVPPPPYSSEQPIIHDHEYFPEAPPAITEDFKSGKTVTLSLWTSEGRLPVAIISNVCNEIDDTGVYSWSTVNIEVLPIVTMQYMWVMTDGATTKVGHFRLTAHEGKIGKMPRPGEEDTFIRRI